MTVATAIHQYKEDTITSAPPEKILLMLYEGAMRNMNLALTRLSASDRAGFSLHLGKGQAIVSELVNSLDTNVGGEICKNLEKLYLFVIDRLMQANLKCEGREISHCLRIMKTLKEGWEDAVRQTSGSTA